MNVLIYLLNRDIMLFDGTLLPKGAVIADINGQYYHQNNKSDSFFNLLKVEVNKFKLLEQPEYADRIV